jgi:hypothetical protein
LIFFALVGACSPLLLIRSRAVSHYLNERKDAVNKAQNERWKETPRQIPSTLLKVCLWAVFAAGLLVEMAAPRLKIENNAFVMPPISNAQAGVLRPDVLVRRERWMQAVSGVLSIGGALGLGFYYRRTLRAALKG